MNICPTNMTTHQIGYACMTLLIILAFILQAVCFVFNNWYRMDFGTFVLRTGLWEIRIYDDKNITGLDAANHELAEFRFYFPLWKSAIDRIHEIARKPPPKKKGKGKGKTNKTKSTAVPTEIPLDQDPDNDSEFTDMFNDPDYNQLEHLNFKMGENWFNLPRHIPNTLWDQEQRKINTAEALYSITWLFTFLLMCIFAFHQFLPTFEVTIRHMRVFTAALFITGFLAFISLSFYGSALPPICEHLASNYERSPNTKLAEAARQANDCSFSNGYSMVSFSGIFLMLTGAMTAVRIAQLQRSENFDVNKPLLGGAQPQGAAANAYDWNQPAPSDYSGGYNQGTHAQQSEWERLH